MPKQQRYQEIANDLRSKIETREYPPGSRLPSRAELCRIYDVSEGVIDKAMLLLRAQQLTETLQGVGVFVRET